MHLTQTTIWADKVRKVDLCEECAEKEGVNNPTGFSLAELIYTCEQAPPFSERESPQ